MSAGWILAVTVTAAASGVAKYALLLWGERARYQHEQTLERQRQTYRLLVLRQPAAVEVKIVALLAGVSPLSRDGRSSADSSDRGEPLPSATYEEPP